MEKITKKEAIQALSEYYQIPIETIVDFIKNESREDKAEYRIQEYRSVSDANKHLERVALYGQGRKPISFAFKGDGGLVYILFEKGAKSC
ncbi:hypothetical protein ES703_57165 [subsurface metagenome]